MTPVRSKAKLKTVKQENGSGLVNVDKLDRDTINAEFRGETGG